MKKLIVANWKMYLTLRESVALAKKFTDISSQFTDVQLVLCPSFIALEEVAKVLKRTKIKLGAQDVEPEKRGAFTGEVGLDDLREIGVQYVLVGHSERRRLFGETDAIVNKKVRAVLNAGMWPIICVGEPLEVRKGGVQKVRRYVGTQVRKALRGVEKRHLNRVIVAYEPVWAIGTDRVDTPEDAQMINQIIRENLAVKKIPILYGGSVNAKNAETFTRGVGIDGLLIGRASSEIGQLRRIIRSI
ncbi:MAG: triose-phosphate isomerase [bacterium]|nr:triose-phosphate isomerase [bacterium]